MNSGFLSSMFCIALLLLAGCGEDKPPRRAPVSAAKPPAEVKSQATTESASPEEKAEEQPIGKDALLREISQTEEALADARRQEEKLQSEIKVMNQLLKETEQAVQAQAAEVDRLEALQKP